MGGVAQLVGSFWTRDWSGFFLMFLMGVLYIVVGLLFLERPVSALEALTLLLACSLIVSGIFRIVGSLMSRFPQWGWVFVGGVINLVLGIHDLASVAGHRPLGDRPVRGHRHDFQWLDMDHAGPPPQEPAQSLCHGLSR